MSNSRSAKPCGENMTTFIQELRRRTVFKVTGMYVVVSWILAQAAIVFQTALNLPDWFASAIVSLLLIGLPIAILLAWAFEVTPEGVRRTEPLAEDAGLPKDTFNIVDMAIVVGLLLILVFTIAGWRASSDSPIMGAFSQPVGEASVAVLPFVDMSEAGDQAYFGEGIAEEILNILAKSPELSVAARTSSFRFRNEETDLREIGEALNVSYILEGSVRKDGDRLRISAQLARVSDGYNLWVESYDRDVVDLFQVQDDIANAIAASLQASLEHTSGGPGHERAQSIEAYDAFLKGNAAFRRRGNNVIEAIKDYENAVSLDPEFAAAWANLSVAYATLPRWSGEDDQTAMRDAGLKARAERAATKAVELDPGLAASQHALGVTLRDRWQWERSETAFAQALAITPDQPEILEDYVQLLGMLGRWEDAAKQARRLVELDPAVGIYQFRLGIAEWNLGHREAALAAFERQRTVAPKTSANSVLATVTIIAESNGLDAARATLAACGACSEPAAVIAGELLQAAMNPADSVLVDLGIRNRDSANYLIYLGGGEEAVLERLEQLTAQGYFPDIAQTTLGL